MDGPDDGINGVGTGENESRRELPAGAVAILKAWLLSRAEKLTHPYPTPQETIMLMEKTGMDKKQLKNWFKNARKRIWKPMLKKQLEAGKLDAAGAPGAGGAGGGAEQAIPPLIRKLFPPLPPAPRQQQQQQQQQRQQGKLCSREGCPVRAERGGLCYRHGANLAELDKDEDKVLQQVVDDAIQGKVGGMFSIDLTSLDELPSTERAAKVILFHTAKRLASNDGNVNNLERILYALRQIFMLKQFKKNAIYRIVRKIADMQMKELSPSDLDLASTIIKPSSKQTCTAGEFIFQKMRSQILAALAIFLDFRKDENRFPHLSGKMLLELIDWHDKHDEGAPSKIGQTSNERNRIRNDYTYPEDLFRRDEMVLGEGIAITRDELTEREAFLALYGNGKGTGVNLNLPRNGQL